MINIDKMSRMFEQILSNSKIRIEWRTARRIYMLILGLKGLK